ncbi:MAG: hypothetical protein NWR96_06105 [Crocinitomicaceae bacterium]|jgi:hypothetical protein|nr:hypothetical protein [Crocinitomicaceae bacterium]MDP4761188.1 hypothetical protein [Crocinitomicaceae bacterium]
MAEPVIVAGVHPIWNTITSLLFRVAEAVKRQTFNCCACPVTAVNRTAALAKYTIEQLEPIAVMEALRSNQLLQHVNVPEPLKKVSDARTKQRIPVDAATFTKIQKARTK